LKQQGDGAGEHLKKQKLVLPVGTPQTGLSVALIGNLARLTGQTFFFVTRHIALQYIRCSQTIIFARYLSAQTIVFCNTVAMWHIFEVPTSHTWAIAWV
jgi:hypothetical protein